MANCQADVKALLQHIGGKENIRAVSHYMTQMRFVLVDPAKAETDKIEALPSVKGTFTQAGQFQVIIGNDVADFYNQFTAFAGIEGVSKDAVKAAAASNQSVAGAAHCGYSERDFRPHHSGSDLRWFDFGLPQHHR